MKISVNPVIFFFRAVLGIRIFPRKFYNFFQIIRVARIIFVRRERGRDSSRIESRFSLCKIYSPIEEESIGDTIFISLILFLQRVEYREWSTQTGSNTLIQTCFVNNSVDCHFVSLQTIYTMIPLTVSNCFCTVIPRISPMKFNLWIFPVGRSATFRNSSQMNIYKNKIELSARERERKRTRTPFTSINRTKRKKEI